MSSTSTLSVVLIHSFHCDVWLKSQALDEQAQHLPVTGKHVDEVVCIVPGSLFAVQLPPNEDCIDD